MDNAFCVITAHGPSQRSKGQTSALFTKEAMKLLSPFRTLRPCLGDSEIIVAGNVEEHDEGLHPFSSGSEWGVF